jgi:hypothetical protein
MNIRNSFFAITIALCAAPALAGNTVDTFGRASPTPGTGSTPSTISNCGPSCHVGNVQGRAALNYIRTPRPIERNAVSGRDADVGSVFGRA